MLLAALCFVPGVAMAVPAPVLPPTVNLLGPDQTLSNQLVRVPTGMARQLGAQDVFNARSYGAVGSGTLTPIGTAYGSNLAALAGYTIPNTSTQPFSWATNPAAGLTFTIVTTAVQPAANLAPCVSTLSGGAIPTVVSVACWQDPSHRNYLVRPGMIVTGPTTGTGANCITGSVTTGPIPATPIRNGELLPSSTDWAASTAYAVNAVAFSPAGGAFYRATTAGTSGSTGPIGTGSGIADGTVQWTFVQTGDTLQLPTGNIALVGNTSATLCPAGTAITLTISPAQMQALSTDYLGVQSAIMASWQAATGTGALAYMPAGNYQINHSLMNPQSTVDTVRMTGSLGIKGDGFPLTQLTFPVDLGQDQCGMAESNQGPSAGSLTRYSDFSLHGPPTNSARNGVSPSAMDGLCVGRSAWVENVGAVAMHAGLMLTRDHQTIIDPQFGNNGFGIGFGVTDVMGNQTIKNGSLDGNYIASFLIEPGGQMDSAGLDAVPVGFSPYGWYCSPVTPNYSVTQGGALTDSTITNTAVEAVGIAEIYCPGPNGGVSNNTWTGGGIVGMQAGESISNGQGGLVPAPALFDVFSFDSNTFNGTNTPVFGNVSQAVVVAGRECRANTWNDDYGFAFGGAGGVPSASVPHFKCGGHSQGNAVRGAFGRGEFRLAGGGSSWTQYELLQDYDGYYATGYGDGVQDLGLAGYACPADNNSGCLVWLENPNIGPIAVVGGQQVVAGKPVFATNLGGASLPGVQQGLDSTNAIGVALTSGTGSAYISLRPMSAGSPGAASSVTISGAAVTASFAYVNLGSAGSQNYQEVMTVSSTSAGAVAVGQAVVATGVPIGEAVQANLTATTWQIGGSFGTVASEAVTLGTPASAASVDITASSGAGAALVLGLTPIGSAPTVCNDTGTAQTLIPPIGGTFQGAQATASLAQGVCAPIRRTGALAWHT